MKNSYIENSLVYINFLDNKIILCSSYSDNFLLIIDKDSSEVLEIVDEKYEIDFFAISNKRIEIACNSLDIIIFDIKGIIKDIIKFKYKALALSYEPSEKYLIILYEDMILRVYDLEQKNFVKEIDLNLLYYDKYAKYFIKFDKNNNILTFKLSENILISKNDSFLKKINIKASWVEFSNDFKYIAFCYYDNTEDIYIYNTENWSHIRTLNGMNEEHKYLNFYDSCCSLKFTPCDKYLIGVYINSIKIFKFDTGEKIYQYSFVNSKNIAFSDDGKYICFIDKDGLKLFEFGFP